MSDLVERAREEWEALGNVSYHGGLGGGIWTADLTEDDVSQIRELIRELAHALCVARASV